MCRKRCTCNLHVLTSAAMTLDDYLRDKGLTQSDFARTVRVPESQVSLWRRRVRRPSTENRLRLSEATGGAIGITDWPPRARPLRRRAT